VEFLEKVLGKGKVDLDGDSFTILLERWEKESNVGKLKVLLVRF
jgi:hypothetical protein